MIIGNNFIFEQSSSNDREYNFITIHPVHSKDDFKVFFNIPWSIYQNDSCWVPPLKNEYEAFFNKNNLFWTHAKTQLFIAFYKDKPKGRIAVFYDQKFSEQLKEETGFFGFFECCNNKNIAHSLFDEAKKWLRSQSITQMQGPVNGRVDMGCGILLNSFDKLPYFYGTYTPPYYRTLIESYGMKKCKDLVSYELDLNKPIPEKIKQSARHCQSKGISIRRFNRLRTNKELEWWIPLMMDIFSHHWGYIQTSEEEVRKRFGIKQLRYIVDTGVFLVAEKDKKPIGFKWAFPDYNQFLKRINGRLDLKQLIEFLLFKHKIDRGKFHFVGVKKEFRGFGIASLMNYYMIREMKKRGYHSVEIGWIDEDNNAEKKATEKIGASLSKTYRVYSTSCKENSA